MALITEFCLKYYNKNIFKNETMDTLPGVIARCEAEVVRTKAELDKGNFGSYDGWADAQAYYHQALERRSIAKSTYRAKIEKGIGDMERIIKNEPHLTECLSAPMRQLNSLLRSL